MKKVGVFVTAAFVVLIAWGFCVAQDVKRIGKEELRDRLSDPSVVVLDVRAKGDWNKSELKIKGAVREDPGRVGAWMDKYGKDKTLVFYCA